MDDIGTGFKGEVDWLQVGLLIDSDDFLEDIVDVLLLDLELESDVEDVGFLFFNLARLDFRSHEITRALGSKEIAVFELAQGDKLLEDRLSAGLRSDGVDLIK